MNGEQAMREVRTLARDQTLASYRNLNRALRDYCRITSFDFLTVVDDAAFTFRADVTEYGFQDIGLRSLTRIWYKDGDDGQWRQLDENDEQAFEKHLNGERDSNGLIVSGTPAVFNITKDLLRISPPPAQDLDGRFDGVVETPVVGRLKELPGPREYHDIVVEIASGYELIARGAGIIEKAQSEIDLARGGAVKHEGEKLIQKATIKADLAMRDLAPNRMANVSPRKTPLMK